MAATTQGNPFDLPEATLRAQTNAKWSKYGPDVLPAFVAEMDFRVAEPIQAAVRRIVDKTDYGYPMRNGAKAGSALCAAFASRMMSRFGWKADAERRCRWPISCRVPMRR